MRTLKTVISCQLIDKFSYLSMLGRVYKASPVKSINSANSEVRGTAEFHGGAYPPCHTPPRT